MNHDQSAANASTMKRSHSFQSFLHPSPPSSLPDTSPPQTDAAPLLHDSNLSPPYYGRPYQLPPSPSFSELLKPQWRVGRSFSRQPSRDGPASAATTPESSDDELAIAKASEFAQSHTGKSDVGAVGTNEYYGFALYLGSTVAVVLYIGWAFLPSKVLHFIGVYYYPDRWWAVAIPSLATITLIYVFAALQGYNHAITPSLDRLECITDSYTRITTEPQKDIKRGTNGVLDLPAGVVCEILYGQPENEEEEAEGVEENGSV